MSLSGLLIQDHAAIAAARSLDRNDFNATVAEKAK